MLGDKFNFGNLLNSASKVREMMEKTQEELARIEVIGESGAGAIKITMNARYLAKNVEIDPDILKEPKEILEELIVSAFNDASQKIEEITKSKMMNAGKIFNDLIQSVKSGNEEK